MNAWRVLLFVAGMVGCTPLPAGPHLADAALDAMTPRDAMVAEVTADAPPDASPASAPRVTGSFVSSATTSARLSGGFVWHGGGASRVEGWLR